MTTSALSQDTLVLNRAWLAIASTPVRNALRLVYSEAARVVQPETYEVHGFESWSALDVPDGEASISTVRSRLRVPEVIVLSGFSGVPRHELPFTRKNLLRRDLARCQYCGCQPGQAQVCTALPLADSFAVAQKGPRREAEAVAIELQNDVIVLIGTDPQSARCTRHMVLGQRAMKVHDFALHRAT